MTNWAKILIDLSFYPCWDTLSEYTSLWKECPACLFSAFNTYWLFSQAWQRAKSKLNLYYIFFVVLLSQQGPIVFLPQFPDALWVRHFKNTSPLTTMKNNCHNYQIFHKFQLEYFFLHASTSEVWWMFIPLIQCTWKRVENTCSLIVHIMTFCPSVSSGKTRPSFSVFVFFSF